MKRRGEAGRHGRDAAGAGDPARREREQHRLLDYMAPDASGYDAAGPWAPYQPRGQRQRARTGRRRPRAWVVLLVLAAAAWGGLELYDRSEVPFRGARAVTSPTTAPPEVGPPPPPPAATAASLEPATDVRARALVGSAVDLAVHVGGGQGSDVFQAPVRFGILEGTGAVDPPVALTDYEGVARASLLLPPRPGEVVVEAAVRGGELPPVRFSVDVRTGPPARLVPVRGDHQYGETGSPLAEPIVVRVADELDNPVVGAEVFFEVVSGGGAVSPGRLLTDSLGLAAVTWRLGSTPGTQLASVRAPAVGFTATFTATARRSAPAASPPAGAEVLRPAPPGAGAAGASDALPPGASRSSRAGAERAGRAGAAGISGRDDAYGRRIAARYAEPSVTVARRDFSVGGTHVCVLSGGVASCRGADDRGQSSGSASGVMAVAAGLSHACALDARGKASCWGANESGQLGDGSREDRREAREVRTDLRFSTLVAGATHTCGITAWGRAACWGQNLSGQLGDGTRGDRTTPVAVDGALFEQLAAGWSHTCGVTVGGEIYCWGSNADGQIGDGTSLDRLAPRWIGSSAESVVAGSAHTCVLRGTRVLCWGDNAFGQLGDGTTRGRNEPRPVSDLPGTPVAIAAGAVHTCALLEDGSAYCWGQNRHGQLGDGTTMDAPVPTPVSGGLSFTELSAGGAVTCGLTDEGARYCWGLNQSGQLGDGTRTSRSSPAPVGG